MRSWNRAADWLRPALVTSCYQLSSVNLSSIDVVVVIVLRVNYKSEQLKVTGRRHLSVLWHCWLSDKNNIRPAVLHDTQSRLSHKFLVQIFFVRFDASSCTRNFHNKRSRPIRPRNFGCYVHASFLYGIVLHSIWCKKVTQ